jgi:PAS domain S-box-containing protein
MKLYIVDKRDEGEGSLDDKELTAAILDTVNALVVVMDQEGRIVRFNRACEKVTGYSAREVMGQSVWDLFLLPEDVERIRAVFEDLRAGRFPTEAENDWLTKDGQKRRIAWSNTAIPGAEGSVAYVVGTGIDVTERRRVEWALRQARDELETRVEERTAELVQANAVLQVQVAERQRVEDELRYRAAFENLITSISTHFINLMPDEVDEGIDRALQALGEFVKVDRSYVFMFSGDGQTMANTHEWCRAGIEPQKPRLARVPIRDLMWSNAQLLGGEVLHIPCVDELPPEAAAEKSEFQRQGVQALISVPMRYRGRTIGFLGFDSVRPCPGRTWSEDDIALLKIVGQIFVNALEHKQAEQDLRLAYQTLEQRVEDRTRELSTLLEVSQRLASTLELRPLLGLVLDKLRAVVEYVGASIMVLEDDWLRIIAYRGPLSQEEALEIRFSIVSQLINREVILGREPVIVFDVRSSAPVARLFQESAGDELDTTYAYIGSWIGVPLMVQERVIGMMTLDHGTAGYYAPRHARLALAFANQVAAAIENARLFEAEQRRVEQFRMINDVERRMISILAVDELLREICRLVKEALNYYLVGIGLIEGDELVFMAGAGAVWGDPSFAPPRLKVGQEGITGWVALSGEPLLVPDVRQEPRYYTAAREDPIRSELAVPLKTKDAVIGVLHVQSDAVNAFDESDVAVLQSLAYQAAAAIENARLYEQARQVAAMQERQRLARELHDAVTQTLFSASLIAEVLPRIWERDRQEGLRRLQELRELTRGALAEMRTLLLELRPSALLEAELGDLLYQLGESIIGRARVPVSVEVEGECELSVEVKIALYRIAQEALNNVAKHAGASRATVRVRCSSAGVVMRVLDDGQGFDPAAVGPDHLGLGIMRERAEAIGAEIEVESNVGRGTQITVVWSVRARKEGR